MSFERAREIADAVLLEGYVLYPYRSSSRKNRYRWAFGVLAPRAWSEAGGSEPWWLQTECLLEGTAATKLEGRLRFLHVEHRRVEARRPDGGFAPAPSLEVDERLWVPFEEGEVREVDFGGDLEALRSGGERVVPFCIPGSDATEELRDASGELVGRVVREGLAVEGELHVAVEPVRAARALYRLRIRVENTTPWPDLSARREEVVRGSTISTHLLLALEDGAFISLLEPADWAESAAKACVNTGAFPVLLGDRARRDLLLASPIILYDHPRVAPESPGDFFDATEIDELLTLRTRLLTDDEKRQARASDPRAAAIIDRVDAMPPEIFDRLHGALRDLEQAEMVPREPEEASRFSPGDRVRLCPSPRRTDAQDLLFVGCAATVEKVLHDIDGREMLALTLDDDPAAELHRWYGRFHYYYTDEVEPLPSLAGGDA